MGFELPQGKCAEPGREYLCSHRQELESCSLVTSFNIAERLEVVANLLGCGKPHARQHVAVKTPNENRHARAGSAQITAGS
jgi:hypothetical protein